LKFAAVQPGGVLASTAGTLKTYCKQESIAASKGRQISSANSLVSKVKAAFAAPSFAPALA